MFAVMRHGLAYKRAAVDTPAAAKKRLERDP
jgi:hypothetical protein